MLLDRNFEDEFRKGFFVFGLNVRGECVREEDSNIIQMGMDYFDMEW